MKESLKIVVSKIRNVLRDDLDSIIFADFHDGRAITTSSGDNLDMYYSFLKEVDGARCGVIDFWSFDELNSRQFRISEYPEEMDNWVEIGQILYEPLIIDRRTGHVLYINQGVKHFLGGFNHFLENYVFGEKYTSITPDFHSDEWFEFLKRMQLV